MKSVLRCRLVFIMLACVCASLIVGNNAAQAAPPPKHIDVSITQNSQLGTTTIGDAANAGVLVVVGTLEDNPDQNALGAKFTFSWSILSTESRTAPNAQWQASPQQATVAGGNAKTATVSTDFDNAAYYQIKVHVSVDFVSGTGDDTWHGEATKTISQTAVGVKKIQFRDSGQGAYADVPNHLIVLVGSSVDFEAITDPDGASWPTGKPVWGGSSGASGNGATTTVTFNNLGNVTVTVSCGNTITATVTVSVIKVEIAVKDHAGQTNDLYVRLGGTTTCHAKVIGNPANDVAVVLTNPDSKLTFDGAQTLTLNLDKNGAWSDFGINGVTASSNKDDAVIQAHKDTTTGTLIGEKDATVFWFDDANLIVSVGGYYGLTNDAYTATFGDRHGVNYAASVTVKPGGLDGTSFQLAPWRIGIMQNVNSSTRHFVYDTPVNFQWLTTTSPLTVATYEQYDQILSFAGPLNDSSDSSAPIFAQGSTSLTIPFGLNGGDIALAEDTPSNPFPLAIVYPVEQGGEEVAEITYSHRVKTTFDDSFETWAVLYNIFNNQVIPLRQAHWELKVDSSIDSNVIPQKANVTTPNGGTTVTTNPVESTPYANDVAQLPSSNSVSLTGTPTNHTQ